MKERPFTLTDRALLPNICLLIFSKRTDSRERDHQEKNARALEEKGAACVLLEPDCTAQRLMDEITGLLADKQRYAQMRKALLGMSVPDSAERLCGIMEELIGKK